MAVLIYQNKESKCAKFLIKEAEINLMREILKFEEVIEDTANDYEVHNFHNTH
jgi:arginyl-tRNA synthetase